MLKRRAVAIRGKGRPPAFDTTFVHQAFIACSKLGATVSDLSELFAVRPSVVYNWITRYQEFRDAIKNGRDIYDTAKVEAACLRRALGYEFVEKQIERTIVFTKKKKNGKVTKVALPGEKVKTTTKHIPPDPSSIFFWLQNRNSRRWKNAKYLKIRNHNIEEERKTLRLQMESLRGLSVQELELLSRVAQQNAQITETGMPFNTGDGTGEE